jgi:hypothetical protein
MKPPNRQGRILAQFTERHALQPANDVVRTPALPPMDGVEAEATHRRVDELMANLARLEADEEALIEAAVSEGLDMLRRQNADRRRCLASSSPRSARKWRRDEIASGHRPGASTGVSHRRRWPPSGKVAE